MAKNELMGKDRSSRCKQKSVTYIVSALKQSQRQRSQDITNFLLLSVVRCRWLALARESLLCPSCPNSEYSDLASVSWNHPWREHFQHRDDKRYKSELYIFFFREPVYQYNTCYFMLTKSKIHKGNMHYIFLCTLNIVLNYRK